MAVSNTSKKWPEPSENEVMYVHTHTEVSKRKSCQNLVANDTGEGVQDAPRFLAGGLERTVGPFC